MHPQMNPTRPPAATTNQHGETPSRRENHYAKLPETSASLRLCVRHNPLCFKDLRQSLQPTTALQPQMNADVRPQKKLAHTKAQRHEGSHNCNKFQLCGSVALREIKPFGTGIHAPEPATNNKKLTTLQDFHPHSPGDSRHIYVSTAGSVECMRGQQRITQITRIETGKPVAQIRVIRVIRGSEVNPMPFLYFSRFFLALPGECCHNDRYSGA